MSAYFLRCSPIRLLSCCWELTLLRTQISNYPQHMHKLLSPTLNTCGCRARGKRPIGKGFGISTIINSILVVLIYCSIIPQSAEAIRADIAQPTDNADAQP